MYNIIITTALIILLVYILGMTIIDLIDKYKSNSKPEKIILDINPANSEMFLKELDKMILYQTVYEIDSKFGDRFRDIKGVDADIDNDDIYQATLIIGTKITDQMSDIMKDYLYNVFGKEWIIDYINIQTLSMALNYAQLNINMLTKSLF